MIYEAVPAERFSPSAATALREGRLDAVAFFSPRTAETFVRVVEREGLVAACEGCHALCLSEAVAGRIDCLGWAGIRVAARPNSEAILAVVAKLADKAGGGAGRA